MGFNTKSQSSTDNITHIINQSSKLLNLNLKKIFEKKLAVEFLRFL